RDTVMDEEGVGQKFGVPPSSIPDLLALMGDAADGIPGIPRWGQKSSAAVLSRYGSIEGIPANADDWDFQLRGAQRLASNLRQQYQEALLYKRLATLRTDAELPQGLDALRWRGARREELEALCKELGESRLLERIPRWE
ncbi:MAG: 5'-3' exonuclease H3TH domain-containing protein, partial [Acidobacteriota bacterium]